MAPVHFQWESDGKYVALRILFGVALEDPLHGGAGLVRGASVDVDAVGIAWPEVESEERLENSRLCNN